jgi:hypothetical protein
MYQNLSHRRNPRLKYTLLSFFTLVIYSGLYYISWDINYLYEYLFVSSSQSTAEIYTSLLLHGSMLDWLIIYGFTSRSRIFHLCRWRAAKFRLMLGAKGLWAGRDLYRATPTVKRNLGFSGLIPNTAPFSRLLRHEWGCRGPILTRILTGANAWRIPLLKYAQWEWHVSLTNRMHV